MKELRQLASWLAQGNRAVFFGGAGVSTESGIPDFRGSNGLYRQGQQINPETILSRSFFDLDPETFYVFYKEKMLFPDARPNAAHKGLARLEEMGHLSWVITQNIDGLHQKAGSRKVLELHGTAYHGTCLKCKKSYHLDDILAQQGAARCACSGLIKPDVVLYEEPLNDQVIQQAVKAIQSADLLLIGGTSLMVQPAASFARLCPGRLVIINRDETPLDRHADLVIHQPIGQVFEKLMPLIEAEQEANPDRA